MTTVTRSSSKTRGRRDRTHPVGDTGSFVDIVAAGSVPARLKRALRWGIRDAFSNLRRNLTLTLAAVLTAAVSLSLVGGAVLLRTGVDNATQRWADGVEFIVYMDPTATQGEIAAMANTLGSHQGVTSVRYLDAAEAYEEFSTIFSDQPELTEAVTPEVLPTSFRVVPIEPSSDAVDALAATFENNRGVYEVVTAAETVRRIQSVSEQIGNAVLAVAIILVAAAALLIGNTIRMAMFARRDEIEVMRLVGAGSWWVRGPFLLEGFVTGAAGGTIAAGATWMIARWGLALVGGQGGFALLAGFEVTDTQTWLTVAAVASAGAALGVAGTVVALRRHLKL